MKKTIPLVLGSIFVLGFILMYNSIVNKEENITEAFSQIESTIQRKADLLPNLVKVVKAYAKHEKETFEAVAKLRTAKINTLNEAPSKEQVQKMIKLNKAINNSTLKLFAVAEQYPQLRSSEQFLQLQAQIEGTENRINITRMNYNSTVKEFNAQIRRFPSNLIASSFGFSKKEYFKAQESAKKDLVLDL